MTRLDPDPELRGGSLDLAGLPWEKIANLLILIIIIIL
jgi:hypothetical protein